MEDSLHSRYKKGRKIEGPVEWVIQSLTPQYQSKFVSIEELALLRSDGAKQFRSLVMIPDSVMIVPVTPEKKILLIRPLRPGALTQDWELPAERGENPDDIENELRRCAKEEVGLVGEPTATKHIATVPAFPDRLSEMCRIYAVYGTFDIETRGDPAEIPDGAFGAFSLDEALRLAESGAISCTRTISALFLMERKRAEFNL